MYDLNIDDLYTDGLRSNHDLRSKYRSSNNSLLMCKSVKFAEIENYRDEKKKRKE